MARGPVRNCLTKFALALGLILAGGLAHGEISNAEAKKTARWILNDHRPELRQHPLPLLFEFDETRQKPGGMFGFLFVAYSAHIQVQKRVLKPGTRETTVNVMKISGYLPSLADMTSDIFALIVCHELAHVIGGAPVTNLMKEFPDTRHSIEGQADYYAAAKCFKRYAKAHPQPVPAIEPGTWALCARQFAKPADALLCARAIKTGEGLVNAVRSKDDKESPSIVFSPSLMIDSAPPRTEMFIEHPDMTCRLRTIAAGALCNQPVTAPISGLDARAGWCEDSELARRPHCWYARP